MRPHERLSHRNALHIPGVLQQRRLAYLLATTDARSFYGFHKRRRETIKRPWFKYFAMSDGKT